MPYRKYIKRVPGLKTKGILLFTLSTCIWCKKTKVLLKDLGLEHSYVDVDLLFGPDQEEAYKEIRKHNQGVSFPMIIINNGEEIVIGYEEEKLKSLK